ncbi:MAG: aminoglycoside phosphotransferase family protein [Capsulimonadales bacterium]|nr:aminoglycoside phosphotransferase family protein [Capsulimonadales bacterium]
MKRELPDEGVEPAVTRLHAGFRTPRPTLFDIVREAVGQEPDPESVVKIVRGYDSEVYRVRTVAATAVVIRIRRDGDIPYEQEAWALEQAGRAGVPVPEVLLLTERRINRVRRPVMVQRCLPGRNLVDLLPVFTGAQKERVLRQAGEALRRLHTVAVDGFYRRRSDGTWDFPDWASRMASALREREEETPLLLAAGLTDDEIRRGLNAIERYTVDFPCPQPVLLHADVSAEHFFADETGNLTGMLDFGDFYGGPPEADIAYFTVNDPELPLEWLLDGYGDRSEWGDREAFLQRLLRYQVVLLPGDVAFAAEMENAEETERLLGAYRAVLNRLAP